MVYKTIVDENGNIVDLCVVFISNIPQYFAMEEGQQAVTQYTENYIKPIWDFDNKCWVEGATEEEIKAWNEENKVIKQTTTEEKLIKEMATLKIDNMKKDTVISNLTKAVAELKIKIMNMEEGK